MNSSLRYKNANLEDLPKIVEIYNTTIASRVVTADTEPVSVESRLKWFNDHNDINRPIWMVQNESSETIGWVSFQSFYGRPAYNATVEVSIYLDPLQRGKGYGNEILAYCIQQAPSMEIKTLLGFIFSHNEPSLKLFQKFGFEAWGEFPNIAVLDNIERSLTIMGKRIA